MELRKTRSKFLWFGEERFKITDYSVANLIDPFNDPIQGRYCIEENSGGGIKGIMSVIAAYVSDQHKKQAWRNEVKERWGCSTGAIVEACLALGMSYKDLLDFYVYDGPIVFDERAFGMIRKGGIYSADKLEAKLKSIFGDITMEQLYKKTGVKLYIVTYDAITRRTVIINHDDYYGLDTSYFPIWVAVRASMSAPYYFGAFTWNDPVTNETRAFLDGGITGWNCSAGLAYEHSIVNHNRDSKNIQLLSIGTGYPKPVADKGKMLKKLTGFLNIKKQLQITMNALMESNTKFQVEKLLDYAKNEGLAFQRWDIELTKDLTQMDETDNIDEMFDLTVENLS